MVRETVTARKAARGLSMIVFVVKREGIVFVVVVEM